MIGWIPGAAPSMAGIASTRESLPLRHEAGAAAPTIPGTVRTLAAIALASPPFSTRTTNGFIAPGLMFAFASISLPAIAVPVPGKFLSCASFGLICKP